MLGYRNPFRNATITPSRIDQGVDYYGSGPIYALAPGVIVQTMNGGWQPGGAWIVERLTAGPFKDRFVYVAEQVQPSVRVGQHVDSSTVLGYFAPEGGGIETGWALPPGGGESLARASGQWDAAQNSTAYGQHYADLLAFLGAPKAILHPPVQGTVGKGWPTYNGKGGTSGGGGGAPGAPGKIPSGPAGCLPGAGTVARLTRKNTSAGASGGGGSSLRKR
jgi:hypothetical protein